MDKAYLFRDGMDEFTPPPGTKVNKQFRSQVRVFLSSPARAVSEFPLHMFSSWFQDLPLSKIMNQNEREDSNEIWQYKVVTLYPARVQTNKAEATRFKWATEAARQFYSTSFNSTEADLSSIDRAVNSDPSIMIVGRPLLKGEDPFKKSVVGCQDSVVIACITFRSGIGDEVGASLVLWLLIAESESRKPSGLTSWRRQGFGRLMLVMLIKHSTFLLLSHRELSQCQESLHGVDIYLQCPHDEPKEFYQACGFRQINLQDTTGIEFLPKTIADTLMDETTGGFAWIVPESEEHCIIPLMKLSSGSLLNSAPNSAAVEVVESNSDVISATNDGSPRAVVESEESKINIVAKSSGGSPSLVSSDVLEIVQSNNETVSARNDGSNTRKTFAWCQYPSSTIDLQDDVASGALLTNADLEEAFTGLDYLNNLLPPPFGDLVLPDQLRGCGEVGSQERLDHSKSGGKTWMATRELQMMTSLLMRDGRYHTSVAILSFDDMQVIQGCFGRLQRHLSAKKYENDLMAANGADHAECLALVKKRYGSSKEELYQKYDDQMNRVVKEVLLFYPGLLQKRLIVFPTNLGDNHWAATFVFNAGDVVAATDDVSCLRTCFFRYCSLHPSGTTKIPNNVGVVWFLNLAFSYQEQRKNSADDSSTPNRMKWLSPFGRTFFGQMKGTNTFPALRVLDNDVLPLQEDGHSCGIGVIAAIAIILRDIIGTQDGVAAYNEMFRRDRMEIQMSTDVKSKEHICCFPQGIFTKLFKTVDSASISYLHAMKAQWFLLFDRIAEFQHVTVPKRQNSNHLMDPCYGSLKLELQTFRWPWIPVPSNAAEEDCVTSQDNSVTLEDVSSREDVSPNANERSLPSEEDVADFKPSGSADGPEQKEEDIDLNESWNDPAKLPRASRVWKGGPPRTYGYGDIHVPDECPKLPFGESRYKTLVSDNQVEKFRKKWRKKGDEKDRSVLLRDKEAMNKFVENRFLYWGWSSTKDHLKNVEKKRAEMQRKIDGCKKKKTKEDYREQYTKEIKFMKKERKKFQRAFELEWTFGTEAMVHGLKYNPREDTFVALLVYNVKTKEGKLEKKEEKIAVSKDWIKDADYAKGVIQHVINLGNTDGFVPVPEGETILIHTKKVHKLQYVHPHTRWVVDPQWKRSLRSNSDSPGGKHMKQIQAPGYWEVIFHGETQPIRTDEDFVKQFKTGFLEEVKRMRCGFVDIPVGDFKESHLHAYPKLQVPEAPQVHFVQSEGEDLCVSKSLASALYAIGFDNAAKSINHFGESQLRGGTVDAIRKVGQFAETQLPTWITRKVLKRPHMFDWQLLQEQMKDTMVLAVLNESDGNGSHAVTIHSGFVYDANEVVAIPLCKEALDYCCSTSTVKNEFVSFRKATLFFYDGPDINRKASFTLWVDSNKRKRADGDGPKIVRARTDDGNMFPLGTLMQQAS